MALLIDKTQTLNEVITSGTNKVLLIFYHGLGDVVMFLPCLEALVYLFPEVKFSLGLCRGLDEEKVFPDAVLLDGDWREKCKDWDYDIVFCVNFNCEDASDTTYTKAELCCINELGIPPTWGHPRLPTKGIVGVCFNITSLPHLCNPDEATAKLIWQDIIDAGYVPVEIMMEHVFYNPVNKKFDFVDNTLRPWPAKVDTLMAMVSKCDYLVSVVTGVFHLGLSILGKDKVMLLEKDIPLGCFTHDKVETANLKDYKHEVLRFLCKE